MHFRLKNKHKYSSDGKKIKSQVILLQTRHARDFVSFPEKPEKAS